MELLPKQIAWKIIMLAISETFIHIHNNEFTNSVFKSTVWSFDFKEKTNLCNVVWKLRCVSKDWNSRIRDMLVWKEHRGECLYYMFKPEVLNLFKN